MTNGMPPDSVGDAPITIQEASQLMAHLGFVAFRTPPGAATPDTCLMAMIHDVPTLRHFDPERASFWVLDDDHGRIEVVDRDTPMPLSRPFSWGRIRLIDRLGMRNSFVGFGGWLDGERVGPGATLLIFSSQAPILRLPGHSQLPDGAADQALTFFGRMVPRLWSSPDMEALVADAGPEALHAAFLVYSQRRLAASAMLRDAAAGDASPVVRELDRVRLDRPEAIDAGRQLLDELGLAAGSP